MIGTPVINLAEPVAWDEPLNRGLTNWWMPLKNNRSLNRFHNLVNANRTGTWNGTAATRSIQAGPRRSTYAFDLSGSYATCGNDSILTTDNWAVSWVARVDTLPDATNNDGILCKRSTSFAAASFMLYVNANSGAGARKISFNNPADGAAYNFNYVPTVFDWTHYLLVFTLGGLASFRLYVDGKLQDSQSGVTMAVAPNSETICIGVVGTDHTVSNFNGALSEISTWEDAAWIDAGSNAAASFASELYEDHLSGYRYRLNRWRAVNKALVAFPLGSPKPRQASQRFDPLPVFDNTAYRQDRNQPLPPNNEYRTRQPSQTVIVLPELNARWDQSYMVAPYSRWYVPTNPSTRQPSQRIDPLPNFNYQHYVGQRQAPEAAWIVPGVPWREQASQRVDPLPVFDNTAWRQDRNVPTPTEYDVAASRQASQRVDPLPVFDNTTWRQDRNAPAPMDYDIASSRQSSQRVDPLPVFDNTAWRQDRNVPTPTEYDVAASRQASQRVEPLPKFDFEWYESYRVVTFSQWYVPDLAPTSQASQRVDPLPVFDFEWYEAYRVVTFSQWYVPTMAPTRQASQRVDPLPDFDYQVYEGQRQPPDANWYVPEPAPTQQPSQRVDPLPVYDFKWFQQKYDWAIPVSFVPDAPATRQRSQRVDPLPVFNYRWYEQRATWPLPQEYIPPQTPWFRQASQRVDPLPVFDFEYYEQFTRQPTPSGVLTAYLGVSGIFVGVTSAHLGISGVRNDIAGYNVYVGVDVLPDLEAPPTAFSQTLPVSVATTPPASGTRTYYVIVRLQNQYGLESQNQYVRTITVDSSGNLVLPPISPPQGLQLTAQPGGKIRVLSTYSGWHVDKSPATEWKVWVGTSPPDTEVDVPVTTAPVVSNVLAVETGPFLSGTTYYIAVALFRSDDGAYSNVVTGSVALPIIPGGIDAVPGGYEDP
jgi:hypothetical protein